MGWAAPTKLYSALMLAHECHLLESSIFVAVTKGSYKMMEDIQTQSPLRPGAGLFVEQTNTLLGAATLIYAAFLCRCKQNKQLQLPFTVWHAVSMSHLFSHSSVKCFLLLPISQARKLRLNDSKWSLSALCYWPGFLRLEPTSFLHPRLYY